MTDNVSQAVNKARDLFEIKDFPGNFFSLFEKQNYAERYKLLLFKEDIARLSGFIGYGDDGISVICINYKRPIGHQNFTFAHELGHWIMHKGQNISDDDKTCSYSTEKQAAGKDGLGFPQARHGTHPVSPRFSIGGARNAGSDKGAVCKNI